MVVSYIRQDKYFDGVYDQYRLVTAYAQQKNMTVDKEFIDHKSQNKQLSKRAGMMKYFQSLGGDTLLVYDVWVLSSFIDDLLQILSCLLKNGNEIHFVKPFVIISRDSDVLLVMGLMDQLRQTLEEDTKKGIGRPKGSRSSSKFDRYHDDIISYLRENKSVSEMARALGVSRSSLKDYIESRELKKVALGNPRAVSSGEAEASAANSTKCPVVKQ